MSDHQSTVNSLLDIEERQNEVLRQLEELNHRVEQALANITGSSPRVSAHHISA